MIATRSRRRPQGGEIVPVVEVDASDAKALRSVLDGATAVVYAAGGLMPGASERDPVTDIRLALEPWLTTLGAATEVGAHVVFLSSGGTVYGIPEVSPVPESHPTRPIGSYGILKLTAEMYGRMYAARGDLGVIALRCANVYGPQQTAAAGQGFIAACLENLEAQRSTPLYGDGSVARDFVHVDDVADVVCEFVRRGPETDRFDVFNVGSGVATSMLEIVTVIEDLTGRPLELDRMPARVLDVPSVALDCTALRAAIGFEPVSLREGLERTLVERGLLRTAPR